jgi:hypothetical protein
MIFRAYQAPYLVLVRISMDFLAMQREIFSPRPRCSTLAVHPVPKPQGSGTIGGATLWWMQEAAQHMGAALRNAAPGAESFEKGGVLSNRFGGLSKMAKVHGE